MPDAFITLLTSWLPVVLMGVTYYFTKTPGGKSYLKNVWLSRSIPERCDVRWKSIMRAQRWAVILGCIWSVSLGLSVYTWPAFVHASSDMTLAGLTARIFIGGAYGFYAWFGYQSTIEVRHSPWMRAQRMIERR